MIPETIIQKTKSVIAVIAFKVFLWAIGMGKEGYWLSIYNQEYPRYNKHWD